MKRLFPFLTALFWACSPSPEPSAQGQAQRSPTSSSIKAPVKVETFASGLERPWGLAFLLDGRMLVTERSGRLRIVSQAAAEIKKLTQ